MMSLGRRFCCWLIEFNKAGLLFDSSSTTVDKVDRHTG